MIELMAIPAWNAPPRTLDEWVDELAALAPTPTVTRESPEAAWLEVGSLRLRGYAVIEGPHVSAINFELSDPDPRPATRLVEAAAHELGWEIHRDEDDGSDDEEDEAED